jgi:DnaJ-class molecular chaperone
MGKDNADFDAELDYYGVLGVVKSATVEEIKKAHVKLALESHPDALANADKGNKLVDDGGEKFRRVSEAWQVLSKPHLKKAYDAARSSRSSSASGSMGAASATATRIQEESFATQKAHYDNAVKAAASSNWRESQDKYKTLKWQRMSLDQRKTSRRRAVHSPGGSAASAGVAGILFIGAAGMIYQGMMSGRKNNTR